MPTCGDYCFSANIESTWCSVDFKSQTETIFMQSPWRKWRNFPLLFSSTPQNERNLVEKWIQWLQNWTTHWRCRISNYWNIQHIKCMILFLVTNKYQVLNWIKSAIISGSKTRKYENICPLATDNNVKASRGQTRKESTKKQPTRNHRKGLMWRRPAT